MGDRYVDRNFIANKERGFVIRFGMNDRKEVVFFPDERCKPEAPGFQEGFIGIVDDLELIAEK